MPEPVAAETIAAEVAASTARIAARAAPPITQQVTPPVVTPPPEGTPPVKAPVTVVVTPDFSTAQALNMRASYVNGGNVTGMTPEQVAVLRADRAAKFDAAMAADGNPLPVSTDTPEQQEHDALYGMNIVPTAADYHPNFVNLDIASKLPTERLVVISAETSAFCAALGIAAPTGNALIEHIADVGPKLQGMTPEQKDRWVRSEDETLMRLHGYSREAVNASIKLAKDLLAKADLPFSKALAGSTAFNSAFIVKTLANHASKVAAWKERRPRPKS